MLYSQQVNQLEITPDKYRLAVAGNPNIRLFDINSNSSQPVCLYQQQYCTLSTAMLLLTDLNFLSHELAGKKF